ncbi:MAG: type II secretion system protein [Planctomycetes bacterium]|nr:type II secretion system protein [Planctomycetota bacterium]
MNKNKKAFTLVELLVVISIIALLMAIMMPSLARVKNQAQALVCRNNLRQWGFFFKFYLDNSDDKFFRNMGTGGTGVWMDHMRKYWDENPDLWCCPTATIPRTKDGQPTGISGPFAAWGMFDGSSWTTEGDHGSYGMNSYILGVRDTTKTYEGIVGADFWRYANVKGADKAPILLDSVWCGGWPKHTDIPPVTWDYDAQPIQQQMTRYVLNRHLGFTNGVFLDLSVKKIGLKALWRLKWHRSFDTNYAYDDKTFFDNSFVDKLPNKIE